jgi:tetratricopeptide (TPR) repeat protein
MSWWRRWRARAAAAGQAPLGEQSPEGKTFEELAAEYGVNPAPEPSAFAKALVAASDPSGPPDRAELIAQARQEAQEQGLVDVFDQAVANMSAHGASAPGGTPSAGSDMAVDFDRAITTTRMGLWLGDQTVELALHKALAPVSPERLGEKYARQAAILLRLGQPEMAQAAAVAAVAQFRAMADVDGEDAGYFAYSALTAAEGLLEQGVIDQALRAASEAVEIFSRTSIPAVCIPDAVRALAVLADCQNALGQVTDARQSQAAALKLYNSMVDRTEPPAVPGSMPDTWGLPIIDVEVRTMLTMWVTAISLAQNGPAEPAG